MPRSRKRPVVGFYTDSQGRVRPITSRKGRRQRIGRGVRKRVTVKRTPSYLLKRIPRPLLISILQSILCQRPFAEAVHPTFILANAIYQNRHVIKKLYKKHVVEGVGEGVIKSGLTHDILASAQTELIWTNISHFIPREYHEVSKRILFNVISRITKEEIKYVEKFLQQVS